MKNYFKILPIAFLFGFSITAISYAKQTDFMGGELDTTSDFDDAGCPKVCWNVPNGDRFCKQQDLNGCKIVPDRDSVPNRSNQ
ncbi:MULTISPECIES: hypothetical protein [Arsenophonus]|jgi:hypothetical protein|uniref:hypothetical protein n=1 Tax=Arsenophonus TaxID=637 RepID=UPI0015D715B5|nr:MULTISPECIES: hypothetical protein [Arsenophonus]UBX30297.1 hypothetical protein LDL57_06800 [Arsenophonus apicola]